MKATFFVSGLWVTAFPDQAVELKNRGCEVMSYTDTHLYLTQCSAKEIGDELESSCRKIEMATGTRPALVRCPYEDYDARVLECVKKAGMQAVQWSLDGMDGEETTTEEEIYRRVLAQVKTGDIIRFSNAGRYTPSALGRILPSLKEKGYQFVPLSELLSSRTAMT